MSTVNLQISSYIGFRNSFDQIVGPATYLQTIQDLEGSISTPAPTPTRTLAVSTVSDFLVYTSLPPSSKTVTLTNLGNSTLTVTSITFTSNSVTPSAVFGSGLLVALYTLSDFGAVSLMRYDTFTRAIYNAYRASFDRNSAAALALVLVFVQPVWCHQQLKLVLRG